MRVELPDGTVLEDVPEGTTKEQIVAKLSAAGRDTSWYKEDRKPMVPIPTARQPEATGVDAIGETLGKSTLGRFAQGIADPMIGIGELVTSVLPGDIGKTTRDYWAEQEKGYQKSKGDETDIARFAGNILSPTNALMVAKAPKVAATIGGKIAQGAGYGAAAAATQRAEDDDFLAQKAMQVGTGAALGGAMAPVLSKLSAYVASKIPKGAVPEEQINEEVNNAIKTVKQDLGRNFGELSEDQLIKLQDEIRTSLQSGKKLDAAALMRNMEFEEVGLKPTLGMVTRDPNQYASDINLAGGLSPEITAQLNRNNQIIQRKINEYAEGAGDAYSGAVQISKSLRDVDEKMRKNVTKLYESARKDAGKGVDIPLEGMAQSYADILDRFGDKVPSAVRANFEKFGLMSGDKMKTFDFLEADRLLKIINSHVGADKATNTALGELRGAVRSAVEKVDATGGPFAKAVTAAKERFRLHDAVPALKDVANGTVKEDKFVNKFLINGETKDVKSMMTTLKKNDVNSFNQAKAQVGQYLQKAAFGENLAGDKPIAVERFAKALDKLGDEKLSAFFTKPEIANLRRISRVSSYMSQAPAAAPINNSRTAAQLINLLSRIPGMGNMVTAGRAGMDALEAASARGAAQNIKIPSTSIISEAEKRAASFAVPAGGVTGGLAGYTGNN